MFGKYLQDWQLTQDGPPVTTATSRLLPVRAGGVPAMLKIAVHEEEKRGNALMNWWASVGAAPILAHDGDALLMERAQGDISLAGLAYGGSDDEASRIMCAVLDQLHVPLNRKLPDLVPLARWFEPLFAVADSHSGILEVSASAASNLLANSHEITVLHGDMPMATFSISARAAGWPSTLRLSSEKDISTMRTSSVIPTPSWQLPRVG